MLKKTALVQIDQLIPDFYKKMGTYLANPIYDGTRPALKDIALISEQLNQLIKKEKQKPISNLTATDKTCKELFFALDNYHSTPKEIEDDYKLFREDLDNLTN